MNPYHRLVTEYARLVREGKSYPLGGFSPAPRPDIGPGAAKALFFAPHPDDETIVGGLALRLMREARMNLIDVAVTQGSKRTARPNAFGNCRMPVIILAMDSYQPVQADWR